MNLTALREKVKNALDYSPELQGFNDQVDSLLNDAYLNLWSLKRWTFSQIHLSMLLLQKVLDASLSQL